MTRGIGNFDARLAYRLYHIFHPISGVEDPDIFQPTIGLTLDTHGRGHPFFPSSEGEVHT